jgi:hypothetical protein
MKQQTIKTLISYARSMINVGLSIKGSPATFESSLLRVAHCTAFVVPRWLAVVFEHLIPFPLQIKLK